MEIPLKQAWQVVRAVNANAAQHKQNVTSADSIPDNAKLIEQSIFLDGRDAAHELRKFILARVDMFAPMIQAKVGLHLSELKLTPWNESSDAEDKALARAVHDVIVPMAPETHVCRKVAALVAEINSIDDLARVHEALLLMRPLEDQFCPGGTMYDSPYVY
jgi:hypothetical protein